MNTLEDWYWANIDHTVAYSHDERWTARLGFRHDGVESDSSLSHEDVGLTLIADPITHDVKLTYVPSHTRPRAVWAGFLDWKARNP